MSPPFEVVSIAYICYTMPGQLSSPKTDASHHPARRPLRLWNHWWNLVCELRSACARSRTFLWMADQTQFGARSADDHSREVPIPEGSGTRNALATVNAAPHGAIGDPGKRPDDVDLG